MKTILSCTLILFATVSAFALPAQVTPRIESLKGTITEIVPIDKDGGFSFVRLNEAEGTDRKIIDEIHKAIRQRTSFDFPGQRRPKKGEAPIVLDKHNVAAKVPQLRVGEVITIVGYGVTIPEYAMGGHISCERVTIGK